MTDVTDFIQAAVADKPVAAQKAFAAVMDDRIQDALTAKYDEVSQQVFNHTSDEYDEEEVEVEVDEPTDLETEMEDNDV